MVLSGSGPLASTAIRVAAAGLGAALAGPLGGAIGAALGNVFGASAAQLIATYTERFGEEAGKKLCDKGADSLLEKLKPSAPNLKSAYREAFCLSLLEIREPDNEDWFANWEVCLKASVPLLLDDISTAQLMPESIDSLFRNTMERLDGQGEAIRRRSQSIDLKTRSVPQPLLEKLTTRLPDHFKESFGALIVQPKYEQAWKQAELVFRESLTEALGRILRNTDAILRKVEEFYEFARREGHLKEFPTAEEEIPRVAEMGRSLKEQTALRHDDTAEMELSKFLAVGDLDSALRLKSQKVEQRRQESAKLPRDLYELGVIHELRFEWPQALDKYREAWELGKSPDHGFQYAAFAQKLHRFNEAYTAYQALLDVCPIPADRAGILYSLANLYRETQRLEKAEKTYREAYDIYFELAANPAYLPYVSDTLNGIGVLYCDMGRLEEAEEVFGESLALRRLGGDATPERYLFALAGTLNNLGNLYLKTHRMKDAEECYREAHKSYSELSEAAPKKYRFYLANTLNNFGTLYCDMGRLEEAEEAYGKALDIRRELADAAPDAYLPDVVVTLTNLANLYSSTQRIREAEKHCSEAERILLPLWQQTPELHGDGMARILWRRAFIAEAGENGASTSCTLARRALAAACNPALKKQIQAFIDRLCPEPVL
jgi:tetratricopeptide (TPR) repeat protein